MKIGVSALLSVVALGSAAVLPALRSHPVLAIGPKSPHPNASTLTSPPLPPPEAEPSQVCVLSDSRPYNGGFYPFIADWFEIRGKNWDMKKLGDNGQGLLDNLRGCCDFGGDLENWGFDNVTPYESDFEWLATGLTPIGSQPCVEAAISAAGGPPAARCKDPGYAHRKAIKLLGPGGLSGITNAVTGLLDGRRRW